MSEGILEGADVVVTSIGLVEGAIGPVVGEEGAVPVLVVTDDQARGRDAPVVDGDLDALVGTGGGRQGDEEGVVLIARGVTSVEELTRVLNK